MKAILKCKDKEKL